MSRDTAETLLISAMINTKDPNLMKRYGLTPRHFHGYRDTADWVDAFITDFKRTPNWSELSTKWDDFPVNLDQDDGKYPATEVATQYNRRVTTRGMLKATTLMKRGDVDDGLEALRLLDIHKVVDAPQNILNDYSLMDSYQSPQNRISVPWKSLQMRTMGIGEGELWYLAARPSQGKSIHVTRMAAEAAMNGHRVIIYSMEMTKTAVMIRLHVMLAHMLGIKASHYDIRHRRMDIREYKRLVDAIGEQVKGAIHVHTPAEGACRPSVVSARAEEYDLTVIDYMSLMRPDGGGRAVDDWRVLSSMSNEMKEIALAHNTRILAASQINRDGDHATRPPKLSQMSQSDALAQDGDVVLTMTKYRRQEGASHFSIEKNREGEAQVQFFTNFDVDKGNYDEITREQADVVADKREYGE